MSPRRERLSRSRYSVFHSSTLGVIGVGGCVTGDALFLTDLKFNHRTHPICKYSCQCRIVPSDGRQENFPVAPSSRPTIAIKQIIEFPKKKFFGLVLFRKIRPETDDRPCSAPRRGRIINVLTDVELCFSLTDNLGLNSAIPD